MFGFIILPITFLGGTYYSWTKLAPVTIGDGTAALVGRAELDLVHISRPVEGGARRAGRSAGRSGRAVEARTAHGRDSHRAGDLPVALCGERARGAHPGCRQRGHSGPIPPSHRFSSRLFVSARSPAGPRTLGCRRARRVLAADLRGGRHLCDRPRSVRSEAGPCVVASGVPALLPPSPVRRVVSASSRPRQRNRPSQTEPAWVLLDRGDRDCGRSRRGGGDRGPRLPRPASRAARPASCGRPCRRSSRPDLLPRVLRLVSSPHSRLGDGERARVPALPTTGAVHRRARLLVQRPDPLALLRRNATGRRGPGARSLVVRVLADVAQPAGPSPRCRTVGPGLVGTVAWPGCRAYGAGRSRVGEWEGFRG